MVFVSPVMPISKFDPVTKSLAFFDKILDILNILYPSPLSFLLRGPVLYQFQFVIKEVKIWQSYYADTKNYWDNHWGSLPLSPLSLPHSPQDFSHQLLTSASSHPHSGISLELQSSSFSSRQSEIVATYWIVIRRNWDNGFDFIYMYIYLNTHRYLWAHKFQHLDSYSKYCSQCNSDNN